jgi:hypothetical protein
MARNNFVFFAGPEQEHTNRLKLALSQEFSCVVSSQLEEYEQTYRQAGKFALVFSDPKLAINFLRSAAETLNSMHFQTYAYLNRNGNFTPESQKILKHWGIKVFDLGQLEALTSSIRAYFSEQDKELDVEDLEFYIPPSDEG